MDDPKAGTFVVPSHRVAGRAYRNRVYDIDKWLVQTFLRAIGNPAFRVILWDGREIPATAASSAVGMIIHDRATLCRLLTNPLLHFGDDYSGGRIEIEGGLVPFMKMVYRALAEAPKYRHDSDPAAYRRNQPSLNSLPESRRNIHHHYDIGNDFYQLWLDTEMLYTCAYFPEPDISLDDAQIAKMELICRKLRLQPGQEVVEAGCGWGGLSRYMVKQYGVTVRAYNLSHEQVVYAREQSRIEGLDGRIDYIEDDYRAITGTCDAFVSVGMLEHVGPDHYHDLGTVIDRSLTEQGIGLIHTIGQNRARPMSPWFLKRMFPGSYPPTIREMMTIFEPWGFTVLDVENLRLHYAKTCEHWLERFEQNLSSIQGMFDETFIRAWRLYLSGCIANFSVGALQLFQVVFTRPSNNLVPWTRGHLILPSGSHHGNL